MKYYYLAKNGQRFTEEEWMAIRRSGEDAQLLAKYGPAYTDEAWARHHGSSNKYAHYNIGSTPAPKKPSSYKKKK